MSVVALGVLTQSTCYSLRELPAPASIEQLFYTPHVMRVEYREEPCRTALNKVSGMPFRWSLNPYMGCVHQCTFC
jgi:hypothetical protein